jgi:hypothetical protein
MPNNPKLSEAAMNAQATALSGLLDGGHLNIYDGTQPDSPDVALNGQKLLASLRFGSPAFMSAKSGILKSNAMTMEPDAKATGRATWFRALKSDGKTPILDGTAGISGVDLVLNAADIQQHAMVSAASFTLIFSR